MKPISISLSPNTEKDDVRLALKLIFQPWKWENGSAIKEIEEKFKNYLGVKYAVSFNSGRSTLMAILKSLNLPAGKEVLLQAFTCVAAVNPIIWTGLKPVYVDCDEETFNINISDLKAKTGLNSRVLLVQHTFGLPANMDEIRAVCEQYNLILIEDCAHSLGAEFKGQKVGTFGKAAFFSFGRDKIISSVYGGMAVTNDPSLAEKLRQAQDEFGYPSYFWIKQQLLHPVLMSYIILPLYNILDLGKIFLVLSQWLGILSKAVHWKEKKGKKPGYFPKRLPNALAILALNQFKKLDRFYQHRKKLTEFYCARLASTRLDSIIESKRANDSESRRATLKEGGKFGIPRNLSQEFLEKNNVKHSFLRFTLKHPKAHEIIYQAWHKQNIIIGDWYITPIIPHDTNLESIGYKMGSCPIAEKLSKTTFNLPTHINISQKDAEKIIKFLEKWK